MTQKLIHKLLNFFLPQKCIGCGGKDSILCRKCLDAFPYVDINKSEYIFAATNYNYKIAQKAIWLLKYRKIKEIAEPLAELIHKRLIQGLPLDMDVSKGSPWIIIPIPLSKKRLRERGFNQAELIAKHLLDKILKSGVADIDIGFRTDILYKKFHTDSQVSIKDRRKRLQNIKNSFAIKNSELMKNKNIILIDDVTTTGATIDETRKVLANAGAKKIIATVVAKG